MPEHDTDSALRQLPTGFWGIGQYKANIQRIRDGSEQLDELAHMIRERVDIENKYGTKLEQWNQRWNVFAEQMTDGALKIAYSALLKEGIELSRAHLSSKERMNEEVVKTIELYRKDNYHQSTFRGFKEAKEIEDEFEEVQRKWKKLYNKVEVSKKRYFECSRAEKSTQIQMMNSKSDPCNTSTDIVEKCRERYERSHDETLKARTIYEKDIDEISKFNPIYKESMAFVFEKCQQMEMKRSRFFLEMLAGVQKILSGLASPAKLVSLHSNLADEIFGTHLEPQIGDDLNLWSSLYGIDAPPQCPVFEEYCSELRNIGDLAITSKVNKNQGSRIDAGVVLTKKLIKSEDSTAFADSKPKTTLHRNEEFVSRFGQASFGKSAKTSNDTATDSWDTQKSNKSDNWNIEPFKENSELQTNAEPKLLFNYGWGHNATKISTDSPEDQQRAAKFTSSGNAQEQNGTKKCYKTMFAGNSTKQIDAKEDVVLPSYRHYRCSNIKQSSTKSQ